MMKYINLDGDIIKEIFDQSGNSKLMLFLMAMARYRNPGHSQGSVRSGVRAPAAWQVQYEMDRQRTGD